MRKILTSVFVSLILALTFSTLAHGEASVPGSVVIVQIQAGAVSAATQEFIAIYNNSNIRINISDWCITNKKTSNNFVTCFDNRPENINFLLPSHEYALISSNNFPGLTSFKYQITNSTSGSITGSSDVISLIDANGIVIDSVEWGTGSENSLSANLDGGSSWLRQLSDGSTNVYKDTGIMQNDFTKVKQLGNYADGVQQSEVPDYCSNIDGLQLGYPAGYMPDGNGNCIKPKVSACKNLVGFYETVPDGYALDENNNCQVDTCPNISGLQLALLDGYMKDDDDNCVHKLLPLKITELLPNAIGSDIGNEFIELHNPNKVDVDLLYYVFYIGSDFEHFYSFPVNSSIKAGEYKIFSNKDIKYTLINTTSSVTLRTVDSLFVDSAPAYLNPIEGTSWAIINGTWQYTNRPTPNAANRSSLISQANSTSADNDSNLAPCAANQYRNPLTNRCKLLPEYSSQLTPCKDGQYRSEETNRCRNIVSDIADLMPCAEGQERNPATNRCRNITSVLGDSILVPCKEGQERNPETNRCRNIASMPTADYAPEKVTASSHDQTLYFVLAGVGAVALAYAVWEWRVEIAKLFGKIKKAVHKRK